MNSIPTFEELFSLPELWEVLAAERRDILLYGMGNGADKILLAAKEKGVTVKGVFASDGFVRGQVFHDMPVRSFSSVCEAYPAGECVVLLAFGTARPEVLALVENVARRYPLYVPDVPVCEGALFDADFMKKHREELAAARAIFADESSKRLFDAILAYKLTGRYDYLLAATSAPDTDRHILSLNTVRRMADFGAYNGDTAREMLALSPHLETIVAVEPDRRNFKKLSEWAMTVTNCRIIPHRAAVCDQNGEAAFDASGNRNAGLCTGRTDPATAVVIATPDSLLAGEPVDYIKYDVEGAEYAALIGTKETILRDSPRMKIACYHKSEDLFSLPLLLQQIAPHHRLYLTRALSLPAWDIDILAISE